MKIMVVDDEWLSVETMQEYLLELYPNAQVRCYTQPAKALKALQAEAADVVLLDIQMPGGMNGIQLAMQMKRVVPEIKVLFCTGYTEYALDAFKVHADGYLCKPIMKDMLRAELEHAFRNAPRRVCDKPYFHTFGNFDLFVRGEPMLFRRIKSKEALAWIVDRRGAWVSNGELAAVILENYDIYTSPTKYVSLLVTQLLGDLREYGVEHILERKRGLARVRTDQVDCDYYALLSGSVEALNNFQGEYMSQYSWGENTLGNLLRTGK